MNGQLVLIPEPAMTLGRLRADADDAKACRDYLRVKVADVAGLLSAAGREVGRVEVEDQRPVFQESRQPLLAAILVGQRKIRGKFADSQHLIRP